MDEASIAWCFKFMYHVHVILKSTVEHKVMSPIPSVEFHRQTPFAFHSLSLKNKKGPTRSTSPMHLDLQKEVQSITWNIDHCWAQLQLGVTSSADASKVDSHYLERGVMVFQDNFPTSYSKYHMWKQIGKRTPCSLGIMLATSYAW